MREEIVNGVEFKVPEMPVEIFLPPTVSGLLC